MNAIDFIIIIFLFLGVYNGYNKGLVGSLAGLFSNVLGLIVGARYYGDLGSWLNTQYSLSTKLQQYFHDHLILPQAVFQFNLDKTPLPDLIESLDNVSMPEMLRDHMLIYIQELQTGINSISGIKLGEIVHQYLASALVSILAFLLIWLVMANGIMLIAGLYRRFTKESFIGSIDRFWGAIMGGLVSALIITVLVGLFSPLLTVSELAKPSLFTAVIKTMGEAKTVPYFMNTFLFITGNIISIWI